MTKGYQYLEFSFLKPDEYNLSSCDGVSSNFASQFPQNLLPLFILIPRVIPTKIYLICITITLLKHLFYQ